MQIVDSENPVVLRTFQIFPAQEIIAAGGDFEIQCQNDPYFPALDQAGQFPQRFIRPVQLTGKRFARRPEDILDSIKFIKKNDDSD